VDAHINGFTQKTETNESKIDYYSGVSSDASIHFGDYSVIASQSQIDRSFHEIGGLSQLPSDNKHIPKLGMAFFLIQYYEIIYSVR